MDDLYLHEGIYRGKEALQKLELVQVTVCGAGALGSLLVDNLARQGFRQLSVIDDDRVELHNIGTQLFRQEDVGAFKVDVLRGHCFRAAGIENAACIIAGTTSDAANMYITLTARNLNPSIYIVARSEGFDVDNKLQLAGANRVISPNAILQNSVS